MWSLANKAVLDASTEHAMKSVDEQTPPRIGVVLARATDMDFENLGVFVTKVTEISDVEPGDDTQGDEMHNNTNNNTNGEETHNNTHRCGDGSHASSTLKNIDPNHNKITDLEVKDKGHTMTVKKNDSKIYNLTVADTHGLSYMTEVHMDETMHALVSGTSNVPMALYALRNLTGNSDAFDNDASEVKTLMEKAFGKSTVVEGTTTQPHTVGAAGLGIVRTFPIDLETQSPSVLSTESATTSLFNENRVPTHTVVVHSANVLCSKPADRYMAMQSVTIEEVGGIYRASVVMTRSDKVHGLDHIDDNVYMAAPVIPFERSDARTPRSSDVHVFTAGRHFTANVLHAHEADAPRSLQLPVYAVMHAITQMHPNLAVDIKQAMCVGSMETLHMDASTPLVVMRDSKIPLVAVFATHFQKEINNQPHIQDTSDMFDINGDEAWEKFLCEHARYARIQDKSRSQCKQDASVSPKAEDGEDSYGDNAPTTRTRGTGGMHDGMYTEQAIRDVVYPENVRMALMRHWNK